MSDAADRLTVACPSCGKRYQAARSSAGKQARCSCGVEFKIGAAEALAGAVAAAPAAEQAQATPPVHCVQHPNVLASFACARCHALICQTCDFPQPDGSHLCPTCVSETGGPPTPQAGAEPVQALHGARCQRHPEVAAAVRCQSCGAPLCETCVFKFAGPVYYCPSCATKPSRPLSSTRKGLVIWSMLMAGWVTLFLVVLLSGALADAVMEEPGATLIGALIMIPGLIGLGLACGSLEKRAGNPPIVWVTVIWNGILMAAWIVLCIVGLMAEEM